MIKNRSDLLSAIQISQMFRSFYNARIIYKYTISVKRMPEES